MKPLVLDGSGMARDAGNGISTATWALVFAFVGLAPAMFNGFPLYHPDSAAYSGGYPLADSYRVLVPSVLAKALWPLLDVWSLPVINTTMFAIVMMRFSRHYLPGVPRAAVAVAALVTGVPFFVSAIMPDVWIAVAYLALATLLVRFSWLDFLICVIAFSGHGMNVYILLASVPVVLLFGREMAAHAVKLVLAVLAGAFALQTVLDLAVHRSLFPEKLGTGVIASKVINDVPEVYADFCGKNPGEKICRLGDKIRRQQSLGRDRDDQYIWFASLMKWDGPADETLTWTELNAAGLKLGWHALKHSPLTYARKSFEDFIGGFMGRNCAPTRSGFVPDTPENEVWLGRINTKDRGTPARDGIFTTNAVCDINYAVQLAVFFLATLMAVWLAFAASGRTRLVALMFAGAIYANDLGFAFTAASSARYHERILLLAVAILMLAWNHRRAPHGART